MSTATPAHRAAGAWVALAVLTTMGGGCSPASIPADMAQTADTTVATSSAPPPPPPHLPEPAAEDPQPASTSQASQSQQDRWWRESLADVYDALERAAASGDMSAAYALGSRSARCETVLRRDTPESLIRAHRDVPTMVFDGSGGEPAFRLETREGHLQEKLTEYEDCAVLGQNRAAAGAKWLERAGRSGEASERRASAQRAFVAQALDGYESRGALIADIEEASRRRTLAREWLEELLRQGDDSALHLYVQQLSSGGGLYARDEMASLAHEYALELVRSRREGGFERVWREGPQRYGERSSAEWDQIAARGRDVYREHFARPPVWREHESSR